MEQRRKVLLGIAAIALIAGVAHHPSADIRVMTHDAGDLAPQRFQAAVDLGLMGVSVLVTWTAKRLPH